MKPPSAKALRRAAESLAGAIAAREMNVTSGIARDPIDSEELEELRSVRAWILGHQIPIAERRERAARSREADRQARIDTRKPCPECGELLALDHAVCFYCATGYKPPPASPEALAKLATDGQAAVDAHKKLFRATVKRAFGDDAFDRCTECGGTLANISEPNYSATLCPECDRDRWPDDEPTIDEFTQDEADDHGSECHCEECAAEPAILPRGGPFYVFNEADRQRAAEPLTAANFDDEIPFGLGPAIRELAASQGKTITRIGAPRKKK